MTDTVTNDRVAKDALLINKVLEKADKILETPLVSADQVGNPTKDVAFSLTERSDALQKALDESEVKKD